MDNTSGFLLGSSHGSARGGFRLIQFSLGVPAMHSKGTTSLRGCHSCHSDMAKRTFASILLLQPIPNFPPPMKLFLKKKKKSKSVPHNFGNRIIHKNCVCTGPGDCSAFWSKIITEFQGEWNVLFELSEPERTA